MNERYEVRQHMCGWHVYEGSECIAECAERVVAERIAAALNAQAGWLEQHARDGAELRRLCEARDQYKNEVTRLEVRLIEREADKIAVRARITPYYRVDKVDAVIRELEAERDAARAELKQAHITAWAIIRAAAGESWLTVPAHVVVSAPNDCAIERIDDADGCAFRAIDAARGAP